MEGLTITGAVIALALVMLVVVAQVLASIFGAVDPSAAF